MDTIHARKQSSFRLLMSALALAFIFVICSEVPIFATSSQYVCTAPGGWPCGYTGPFTGSYYGGYATVGCIPETPNGTCVVPQIAIETSYLVIRNASLVIDWANESFRSNNRLVDGTTVSVMGRLDAIFYNKTAGSTYMIYYSNARGLWDPQPQLQIENATLVAQSANLACTTTLSFTVNGLSTGIWNMPMIPTGACYTVSDVAQPESNGGGSMDPYLATGVIIFMIIVVASVFLRSRRKKNRP